MRRAAPVAAIALVIAIVAAVCALVLVRSAFAVVVGSSMRPVVVQGDLAVVRKASQYRIGDIVLYRSDSLHRHVLHRIVGRASGRFVIRGDANSFLDPDRPDNSEIIGRYWFTVPRGGSAVGWLQEPLHAALLVFLAALIALVPTTRGPRTVA